MAEDLKAATPDTTFPSGAFLFGADSQSATSPSVYAQSTVWGYWKTLANTWSANGALSAPASSGTGTWITGGTATTTKPYWLIEPTGTTSTGWSLNGTAFGINAASGFTGNLIDLQLAGSTKFSVNSGGALSAPYITGTSQVTTATTSALASLGAYVSSTGSYRFSSDSTWFGTVDVALYRDAANTLALRNSTAAQTFRVYNTESASLTNYERGVFDWATTANVLTIGTQASGTGSTRNLQFVVGGTLRADYGVSISPGWTFSSGAGGGSATFSVKENGTPYFQVAGGGLEIQGTQAYSFSSGSASSVDITLYRESSSILQVNNRTLNTLRDFKARTFFMVGNGTSGPNLNLTVSAAPTSPTDGDIWREDNTNTGLKIRINGVTKTVTVS